MPPRFFASIGYFIPRVERRKPLIPAFPVVEAGSDYGSCAATRENPLALLAGGR